jgi:filamentous hemagglutinin family protein
MNVINFSDFSYGKGVDNGEKQSLARIVVAAVCMLLLVPPAMIFAQTAVQTAITHDGTMGTNVTPNGKVYNIYGGTIRGNNQFHSFDRFSIGTGDTASFNGPSTIQNILSRVTGGMKSEIYGTIKSEITGANLFLLNPAGVVFGPEAALDITGSFHLSSADYLKFDDGNGVFFANKDNLSDSVLTTASPSAFGFLGNNSPNSIEFKGGEDFVLDDFLNLSVSPEKTFTVIGGDVVLNHSSLSGGQTQIASCMSNCEVAFKDNEISIGTNALRGKINLTFSKIRGEPGPNSEGHVIIQGNQFLLEDGSKVDATVDDIQGRGIDIEVNELIFDDGMLSTTSFGGAPAAPININTSKIIVKDRGGRIQADGFGSSTEGDGGAVEIAAESDLTITSEDADFRFSIDATSMSGEPGSVNITSEQASVILNSVTIDTPTRTEASGGSINISAVDTVKLQNNTEVVSLTSDKGRGGDITVTAGNSVILEDSAITASTSGDFIFKDEINSGRAGNILIDSDNSIQLTRSLISGSTIYSTGRGGNIEIRAKKLTLNESNLDTSTFGEGHAGNIKLYVNDLQIEKYSRIGSSSIEDTLVLTAPDGSVLFEKEFIGTGNAGAIKIQGEAGEGSSANKITLNNSEVLTEIENENGGDNEQLGNIEILAKQIDLDKGTVSATTAGKGDAGQITLKAAKLNVKNNSSIASSTSGIGKGGLIEVQAAELSLEGASGISASTQASAPAGSIILRADSLIVKDSEIASSSDQTGTGNAGAIKIQGEAGEGSFANKVTLNNGKVLTTIENENGGDNEQLGNIEISAKQIDLTGSEISSSTAGTGSAGNITLKADKLNAQNSRITSLSTGQGAAGSIAIGNAPISDLRLTNTEISVFAVNGPQPGEPREGNINISSDGFVLMEEGSTITASVNNGLGGDINIQKPQLLIVKDESKILAQTENGTGGRIEISADLFVQSADSLISADAGVGTSGNVLIDAPKIDFQSSLAALSTELLNASAFIKQGCAARSANDISSITFSQGKGLPLSPEGLIQTYNLSSAGWLELPSKNFDSDEDKTMTIAHREMAEGAMAYRGGNVRAASGNYSRASILLERIGDRKALSDALQNLGQTQMIAGEHIKALNTLRDAVTLAEKSGDLSRMAASLNKLGNAHLTFGDTKGAEELLSQGVLRAQAAGREDIEIVIQNNLGNLFVSKSAFEEAIDKYLKSARLAKSRGDLIHEVKALANASRAALEADDFDSAVTNAKRAFELSKGVPDDYEKTTILIHIGHTFSRLGKLTHKQRNDNLLDGYAALAVAVTLAKASRNDILHSYASGNLGELYKTENRFEEALVLVREALQLAKTANASELIFRWHWLEGQLLWAQGRTGPAIDAYYRAVGVIEETRQEALNQYGSGEVYFRNAVAPVYFDLILSLLEASEMAVDSKNVKMLWEDAIGIMEMMKGAELRNYFKDECVAELEAKAQSLGDIVDQREDVAVVYPFLLEDRIELLVKTPSDLQRHTVPNHGRAIVRKTVQRLYETIFDESMKYMKPCQDLYDWLVRPYANNLDETITTIVFVPGGILRTIPIAALHDGYQFLIEKFALAISPGMKLIEPKPLDRTHPNPLLAGVSEAITFPVGAVEPLEEYDALEKVPDELREVQKVFGGEILLDPDFVKNSFEATLTEIEPSIVHIASHAQFSRDPNESFVLAYNQKITINDFAKLIGVTKFREKPIELLMLSACDTAMGDERAALGLAGIGIKAGARSAIGSLWKIGDEPAYELVVDFYNNLRGYPDLSKAEALRNAQLYLYKERGFHPKHWSSFIVINNWL